MRESSKWTGKRLPEGVDPEDGELILEREILPNGKSRAFAGGRPVTAALLKELARSLGDIHGQHDQQQLFSQAVQREMLDGFAGAAEQVAEVASLYTRWSAASKELADLERTTQEKLRQADLWTFQRNEIETVNPQPGEDLHLEKRTPRSAQRSAPGGDGRRRLRRPLRRPAERGRAVAHGGQAPGGTRPASMRAFAR